MLYADLDKIPLDTFIDVFTGDITKIVIEGKHSQEEIAGQSEKLISEYIEIVGGTSLLAEISQRNNLYNLHIKVECMKGVELMIKNKDWEDAAHVLSQFGFSYFPSEHDKIRKKASSILSMSRYMIERANNKAEPKNRSKMDKNYFVRERVAVMSHYGMQLRKNEISAKEYAFMVKKMCDDLRTMRINKKR